jgi:hypothetical protein
LKPARHTRFLAKIRLATQFIALGAGMLFAIRAQATVTNIVWYRLGENDPGAAPGITVTNAVNFVGGHNLTFAGAATYSSDVSTSAVAHTGSSLSVDMMNSAFATNTIVSTLVTNFGMEAWVKPASTAGGQIIMYNGNTATGGWGIVIGSSNYMALFGGKTGFGTAPVVPNVWTHVALVRDGTASTLYVNGSPVATSPATPGVPAGNFALGAPPQAQTNQFFTGLLDEARVFTFAPGQFSTNDLLINRSLVVTTLADGGAGSLRSILAGALDGDTIMFATNGTITLTNGELVLSGSVNIAGPGPTNLIISGNNSNRVFYVGAEVNSSISGITVTDGVATDTNGAGGGIYNVGNLTLNNCVVSSSSSGAGLPGTAGSGFPPTSAGTPGGAGGMGGGIFNLGTLNLTACSIVGNIGGPGGTGGSATVSEGSFSDPIATAGGAGGNGGGLYNSGTATLSACTFNGNSSGPGGTGGAIYTSFAGFSIISSSAQGGQGGSAGAIYNSGSLILTLCTVDGNVAGAGGIGPPSSLGVNGTNGAAGTSGGSYNSGTMTIVASTVTRNNGGGAGGGVYNINEATAVNSLFALNTAASAPDYFGSFSTQGHNLIGNNSGAFGFFVGNDNDIVGTANAPIDPLILPLADNGGPTWTVALKPGSPAMDAGNDAVLGSPFNLTTDQRGEPRKNGSHVDIGAYEIIVGTSPELSNVNLPAYQTFAFSFTNTPHAMFTVLASTNLALPLDEWKVLGQPAESSAGVFQFTGLSQTNSQQFYQVRSP